MPPCHEYNPNPSPMPFPPDKDRIYRFDSTPGDDLAPEFINFYHRPEVNHRWEVQPDGTRRLVDGPLPSPDDSVILNNEQVDVIRGDPQVSVTTTHIIGRLIYSRVRDFINLINCNEEGCFKDSGSEVTPSMRYTDLSYALGRFTIYWEAECQVGPRRCELDLPNCKPGKGSEADYELKIYWRLYDVYDFTGWQSLIPFSWTGEEFKVFGEWNTTHTGTVTTCEDPEDQYGSIICQENFNTSTFYDVMYSIVPLDSECPQPNQESVVDSAMGRLLEEGKQWCNFGHCREEGKDCEPLFSNVIVQLGGLSTQPINDTHKKCLMRVNIVADIRCRCLSSIELPFPKPDRVLDFQPSTSDNRVLNDVMGDRR